MFPLTRLSYLLPHLPCLRGPCPTAGEEVVSRLGLAAGALPALDPVRPFYPQEVGPCPRMTRQGLVAAVGAGLPHCAELGAAETSSRGGPLPSLGSHVLRDPLRRLAGPGLGGDSCHVGEGRLVTVPSGISSTGASPVAALFAYSSAISLPLAPLCAGTHWMITSLSLARMRE